MAARTVKNDEPYAPSFYANCAFDGSARIEPPGKMIVGTMRLPRLSRMTNSAPSGWAVYVYPPVGDPTSLRKRFALVQSGHQVVLYIMMSAWGMLSSLQLDLF